tara:strand:+ start:66 stop:353 length:288 start_codon:yes stop_codon:yes gene_type:complete
MGYTETGIGYQSTDTSKAAANSNYKGKLTIRDRVHQLLEKTSEALSTEDIAALLNVPYGSVQPRLSELQNEDKVEDSGERGKTRWGKACIKWRAK